MWVEQSFEWSSGLVIDRAFDGPNGVIIEWWFGDDVYHEPATITLEAAMARLTGKEAALFMPSGTMSNQIGLRTQLKQPPYSVLCDHRSHVYKYEAGGLGFHSGAAVIPVLPSNGL